MSTPEPKPDASATAGETQTSTKRVDTIWLLGISSILLLTLLPFSSYIASVPFVRDEWGMSNTQVAIVFSVYLVGYAFHHL